MDFALSFLGVLYKVAWLTKSTGVVRHVRVLTAGCLLRVALLVIAISAHALGIMLFLSMWTVENFHNFTTFFLNFCWFGIFRRLFLDLSVVLGS